MNNYWENVINKPNEIGAENNKLIIYKILMKAKLKKGKVEVK